MRSRALALAVALTLAGPARPAPVDPQLRARVEGLLGSYRAVTVAEWRAVGAAVAPVLEAISLDAVALPTRRARALAALGVVQPEAAVPVVRRLAGDPAAPPLLRSAALDAAPGVLGSGAMAFLVPFLRDPDAVVRQRAAEVLATTGPAGCRAVVAEARAHASEALSRTAAACAEQLGDAPPASR